jgi:hypothetical protein
MQLMQQSSAVAAQRRLPFRMVDATDGKTAEPGLTFSAGDIKISKNGGSTANHAGTVTEIANGVYYYEFTASELDTLGFVTVYITDVAALDVVGVIQVVPWNPYDIVRLGLSGLASQAMVTGAIVTDGGNSATTFKTDLTEAVDDYWKDTLIRITSGVLINQVKRVTAYNGTTKFLTVAGGFTGTPASAVTFELLNK